MMISFLECVLDIPNMFNLWILQVPFVLVWALIYRNSNSFSFAVGKTVRFAIITMLPLAVVYLAIYFSLPYFKSLDPDKYYYLFIGLSLVSAFLGVALFNSYINLHTKVDRYFYSVIIGIVAFFLLFILISYFGNIERRINQIKDLEKITQRIEEYLPYADEYEKQALADELRQAKTELYELKTLQAKNNCQ